MSLKSFLSKIWSAITSLFDGMDPELKVAIHIGVLVVENIKNFVDSPEADIITSIIPGEIDDQIKTMLQNNLPIILSELKLADNCAQLTDPGDITECAIKTLQGLYGDIKNAFLHTLSILLAQIASDGKLTWSDGVYLLEWYYQHQYKKTADA